VRHARAPSGSSGTWSDLGVWGLVRPIQATLTSGANGRSLGRASAPKDKSERVGLLIARFGARGTRHLGPIALRHLRFEIGRRGWAGGVVLVTFRSSVHNPKIMLGMLVKVLRGDSIATRRHRAPEDNVTFEDLMRAASNFDVRTVTLEGLTSVRQLLPITVGIMITVMVTIRSAGLPWSHDICRIDGEIESLSKELWPDHPKPLHNALETLALLRVLRSSGGMADDNRRLEQCIGGNPDNQEDRDHDRRNQVFHLLFLVPGRLFWSPASCARLI
jgi:hypothetical protein